jgi:hypothetical protein
MEIRIQEYIELERLGLDIEEARRIAPECNNIRELEYSLYFNDRKIY